MVDFSQERFDFQPRDWVSRTVAWLRATEDPTVLILSGLSGSGRGYFLQAAARHSRAMGHPMTVLTLDLAGFEPDHGTLVEFVQFRIHQRHPLGSTARTRKVATLLPLAARMKKTFWTASLLAMAVHEPDPVTALSEALGDTDRMLCGQRPRDREALARFLAHHSTRHRCVLRITDRSRLTANQRRWLIAEAELNRHLVVALACGPRDETRRVAPGTRTAPLRFDFQRLDRSELGALLAERLAPYPLPAEVTEALWQASLGSPPLLACQLENLVQDRVLIHDHEGGWRLRDESPTDGPLADELERDHSAQLGNAIARHPDDALPIEEATTLAALCGRSVPIELVLRSMNLPEARRSRLLGLLEAELVRSQTPLFDELSLGHPGFPRHRVWRFRRSLAITTLRMRLTEEERAARADRLLTFLENRLELTTRGITNLFHNLAGFVNSAQRAEAVRRQLDWWVGPDERDDLTDELERAMGANELDSEDVWRGAAEMSSRAARPGASPAFAWRALALLNAYERAPGGVPAERRVLFHDRRANLLVARDRPNRAIRDVDAALDAMHLIGSTGSRDDRDAARLRQLRDRLTHELEATESAAR